MEMIKQVKCFAAITFSFLHFQLLSAQQVKTATVERVNTFQYLNKNILSEPEWVLNDSIPLNFTTYHTQGLTRAGDFYYLTSVKVSRWPKKYDSPVNGYDRDNGEGVGYLFKFNKDGKLADSIRLGKDEIYHPGGIDYDGKYIWVPVCEYRPHGRSIIYRVNPQTLEATVVTSIYDAIGAVAYNRADSELVGMNWGSRTFYRWKIDKAGNKVKAALLNEKGYINPHFYTDFQDCNYAGDGKMICSGLRGYRNAKGELIPLGGLEIVDMKSFEAGLQLPVNTYTGKAVVLTNNPFFIDITNNKLQCYFVPEDNESVLYVYREK